ncbi:beta strand repeat-containing protein [Jatrophihabitans sp. DSM 45814]
MPDSGNGTGGTNPVGRERAPGIAMLPVVRTGAGSPVVLQLRVTNHAPEPRILSVTALGVDAAWLPRPGSMSASAPESERPFDMRRPVMPGMDMTVELQITPSIGTVPARYPMVVAVQALDPVSGASTAPTAMGEVTLIVDGPGQISIDLQPADVSARLSRRITVLLRNSGPMPAEVSLDVQAPPQARIQLNADQLELQPNSEVRISGRARVRRPRLIGQRARHPYTITARSSGAPRYVSGSLTERAFLGSGGAKMGILAAVVAVWLALALIAIPKLAQNTKNKQVAGPTVTVGASNAAGGSAAAGGADGAAGGGAGGSAGGASGGAAAGGGPAGAAPNTVRLNGSVTGQSADGVTVSLRPTSLVDEQAEGATPIGLTAQSLNVHGLVPQTAVLRSQLLTGDHPSSQPASLLTGPLATTRPATVTPAAAPDTPTIATSRSMLTGTDGAWSFPGINAPGYYLATFAKPGYQTQRFVINSAETVATQPLVVNLNPGQGSLTGTVTGPNGPVGGAQLTITDGTNTITTSTASTGPNIGNWSATGLSTPSTYLVSASKEGLDTESALVPLGAGASATASLVLRRGIGSILGFVQGPDSNGVVGGVGGATVTASDGTLTRTATTITTAGLAGKFNLSSLPSPGKYTVTISAPGYQPATQFVTLAAGAPSVTASATLVPSSATIGGILKTNDPTSDGTGGGLVLTNSANTYKTLAGAGGVFRFNGIAPGSYVLSADLFGFTTSYLNVKAIAGLENLNNVLTVKLVPTGVLPSTSFIKGQVSDARAGGHITCPLPTPSCLAIAIDGGAFAPGILPSSEYTAPLGSTGLQPGLHTITAFAPGYQTASIKVQVPLNATVNAPEIAMYPAPIIKGTISSAVGQAVTLGTPASGNAPAVPANPVCIFAVGVGVTPTPAQLACSSYNPPGSVAAPGCPTEQASVPPSPTDVVCTQADANGGYSLTVAQNGGYSVFVTPADDEYRPISGSQLLLPLGGTVEYNATLHRKGRIDVSVLVRNPTGNTGNLIAGGAGISVRLTTNGANGITDVVPPELTDASGSVHFDHLPPGAYTLQATTATGSGSVAAPITDDQQIGYILSLADPLTQVVGRVVTSIGGAAATPVRGAQVQISGTAFYLLGIFPIPGPVVTVTTDVNGCFALTNAQPTTGSVVTSTGDGAGNCTSVTATAANGPVSQATLVSTQVTATVTATGYQTVNLPSVAVTQTGVTTFTMAPSAVTFTGTLSADPASTDLSTASIQPTSQATGSGTLNITSDAQGHLTWHDSNFAGDNQILPGNYTISANLGGFTPTSVSFHCDPVVACNPDLSAFRLTQLTGLQVSAVDSNGTAINGATYTLRINGVSQTPQAASGGSATFTNLLPSSSPSAPTYAVRIQAAGYAFQTYGSGGQPITCTGGGSSTPTTASAITVTAASTPTTCTATLARLGVISGTVTAIPAPSAVQSPSNPSGSATLVATKCNGAGADPADLATATGDGSTPCATVDSTKSYSADTAQNGSFRIAGTAALSGLETGWYRVVVTSLGYDSPTTAANRFVLIRTTTTDTTFNPTITATPVNYTVKVQDRNSSPITGLTVTLVDGNDAPLAAAVESSTTHGSYVFTAVSPVTARVKVTGAAVPTSYFSTTITVGAGNQSLTVTTDLNASVVSGNTLAAQGMDVNAGTAIGGITVQIGTFSGSTFTVGTGTDNQPMTTTSSTSPATLGHYAFNNVPDGANWVVLALGSDRGGVSGYLSHQVSVPVTHSQTTPQTDITLPVVAHDVTVSVSSSLGSTLTGVSVTLTPVATPPSATSRSTLSGTLDPTPSVPNGYSTVFQDVPFGEYTVAIALGATDHGGTLTGGQTDLTLSATTAGAVTDAFALSEGQLNLAVTTTAVAPDTALAQVKLTVRKVGAPSDIYTANSFATNQAAIPIYLPPGSYNVTGTPLAGAGAGWTAVTTSSPSVVVAGSAVTGSVTLTEQGPLPLVVHLTRGGHNFGFGGATDTGTITLTPLQSQTVPAAYLVPVTVNATGNFTFTGLPPGLYQLTSAVSSTPAATMADPTPAAVPYTGTSAPTNITLAGGLAGPSPGGGTYTLDSQP